MVLELGVLLLSFAFDCLDGERIPGSFLFLKVVLLARVRNHYDSHIRWRSLARRGAPTGRLDRPFLHKKAVVQQHHGFSLSIASLPEGGGVAVGGDGGSYTFVSLA